MTKKKKITNLCRKHWHYQHFSTVGLVPDFVKTLSVFNTKFRYHSIPGRGVKKYQFLRIIPDVLFVFI